MGREDCKFSRTCECYMNESCEAYCYPYVLLHGLDGKGGFWARRNVPKKYSDVLKEQIPINSEPANAPVYKAVMSYIDNILEKVQIQNRGLYFTGGTGTGKTTVAVAILNEYLLERCKQHLKGGLKIEVNPVLFLKLSDFQNLYNSQFRGTADMQNDNAMKYYRFKKRMKEAELLVIDDIALRGCGDGFQNELYEILDNRATEDNTTFFTSNVTYAELPDYVGERIGSRVQGMCGKEILLVGKDHREGGLF